MNFSFNEDQSAIRDLARQIFSKQVSDDMLLAFARGKSRTKSQIQDFDSTLWNILAEQGLLGLCVPEHLGGAGLGFIELCLLLEEQGRRVAPVPLFSSLVLGALPLIKFASVVQQRQYLIPLCNGEIKLTAAIAELGMHAAIAPVVTADVNVDQWILNGEKVAVPDGAIADVILVPVKDAQEKISIVLLDTKKSGLEIARQQNGIDHLVANIKLHDVKISSAELLGAPGQGAEIIRWLEQHADTALCAMQVGVCEDALRRTAQFTSERKQFGVPLGSFQAVAMRAADAYIDIEAMRSMYWQAMWRLSMGLCADAEVRAAKWWACQGGHRVVHATQHLHGGMGSDIEFPIHRFFLWAKQIAFMLGNASTQMIQLGTLLATDESVGYVALEVN